MGLVHRQFLDGEARVVACKNCQTHFSTRDEIISKSFNGQTGRAYLFQTVINVTQGEEQQRELTTGLHVVRDIFCAGCNHGVGWKYEHAYEESQKYKEGRFILERALFIELS